MAKIPVICKGVLFLSVVLFQIQNVSCQAALATSSTIAFCISLPRTLQTSHVIKITGSISQSSTDRVIPKPWLNVIMGSQCSNRQSPFHLRMQVGNETTVVGNTFENGHWGEEIAGKSFTFPSTGQFVLLIAVQSDGYTVTCNGVPLWMLPHRLSYTKITKLIVRGASTTIRKIELIDQADPDPKMNTQIFYPVPLEQPASNPTFPFWGYFPGGLQVGKAIRIKGIFPPNVPERKKTAIDLCKDRFIGPIMLHMDIRFKFSTDTQIVVRNYKRDGKWNPIEDRDGPFPFHIGEEFTILIQVEPSYYNISVDGVPYWTYNHRLPFTEVTQVVIGGSTTDILEVAYIDTSEKVMSENLIDKAAVGTAVHASQSYITTVCVAFFVLVENSVVQVLTS